MMCSVIRSVWDCFLRAGYEGACSKDPTFFVFCGMPSHLQMIRHKVFSNKVFKPFLKEVKKFTVLEEFLG